MSAPSVEAVGKVETAELEKIISVPLPGTNG
jgi:hypothetical protein